MSVIYEALKKAEAPSSSAKSRRKVNYRKILIFSLGTAVCLGYTGFLYKNKMGKAYFKPNTAASYITDKQALSKEKTSLSEKSASPEKTRLAKEENKQFILSGIIYSKEKPIAIINGKSLTLGKEINGAKITEIKENEVTLDFKDRDIILTLE